MQAGRVVRGIESAFVSGLGLRRVVLAPLYRLYALRLWALVRRGPLPKHLALILDGNRRFARRGKLGSLREGYAAGADRVDDVIGWCERAGVQAVTLWAMSMDNLRRDAPQISAIASVIEEKVRELVPQAVARGWRLRGIGRREALPATLAACLDEAERATRQNTVLTVQFAVGYGGREEILDALRRWSRSPAVADLPASEALAKLVPEDLAVHLYAADVPDPDLILRTSGEIRLSGFMLWQSVYSEFYFTDVLWPDFREIDFLRAIRDFQLRERRYGL